MKVALRNLWARWRPLLVFSGSRDYWQQRYQRGRDSGSGSGGESARYKASVLNDFVRLHGIRSVIEFGCGDGRQLLLANYPEYTGYDISQEAIARCRELFASDATKRFLLVDEYDGSSADMSISLDVLFHLVEDEVYDGYLQRLFAAGSKFVAIYSSDTKFVQKSLPHVRHRPVSKDVSERIRGFERISCDEHGDALAKAGAIPMQFLLYRRIVF